MGENKKNLGLMLEIDSCLPRFARWEKKSLSKKNVGSFVDCALDGFCWQPYGEIREGNSVFCNVYQETGRWVVVDDCLDEGLESWARCLRVSELVGIDGDCIEQYLPHRVAMQFGMSQDFPGDVARSNGTPEIAWRYYSWPVKDVKLYLPSRCSEPYVTARYMKWRSKFSVGDDENENMVRDESRTNGIKDSMDNAGDDDDDNDNDGDGDYDDDDDDDDVDDDDEDGHDEDYEDDEINKLGLKLEARIGKLEEVFEYLNAQKMVTS